MSTDRIVRRDGGRVIAGVAGGVADHLGIDVVRVRVVFVVLAALAGAGIAAYALLWFFCPVGDDVDPPTPVERRQAYGLAILGVVAASVVAFAASGGAARYLIPLVVVAVGASLVWQEFDVYGGSRRRTSVFAWTLLTWIRIVGGTVAVIAGLVVVVFVGNRRVGGLDFTLVAVAATLAGVVLLTFPLWLGMWRTLNAERAARIRNEEREEIAAHLHDSVLQTLALIQKHSDRPEDVARLARAQERQLREWLFGDRSGGGDSFAAALRQLAAEVEQTYGIEVEVVTVGDVSTGDDVADAARWPALLGAIRESLVNAAKHSGQRSVDLFAEVEAQTVTVFVRDRGIGFDPGAVEDDRQGIDKSIRSRLERRGGRVRIKSAPGRGTEVEMVMPRAETGEQVGSDQKAATAEPVSGNRDTRGDRG
ncbi:ATP-binding protein [Gordonia jinhuaensis]|uniref:Two-component system sensor kinase n=1 Tax=Gordonia jinhuaensis TaxID=1517702 RepID=A0A916SWS9_9ACTN|nr:ATP-binding protein [Gordonia jinhuaensis]GGB17318.1 putative two-component system sensor kinase [Gordonia jinhuaensis]